MRDAVGIAIDCYLMDQGVLLAVEPVGHEREEGKQKKSARLEPS